MKFHSSELCVSLYRSRPMPTICKQFYVAEAVAVGRGYSDKSKG
jgi:hypothetical protein